MVYKEFVQYNIINYLQIVLIRKVSSRSRSFLSQKGGPYVYHIPIFTSLRSVCL